MLVRCFAYECCCSEVVEPVAMLLPMPEVVESDTEPPLEACVAADVGVAGVLVMTVGGAMDTAPTLLFFIMTAVGT